MVFLVIIDITVAALLAGGDPKAEIDKAHDNGPQRFDQLDLLVIRQIGAFEILPIGIPIDGELRRCFTGMSLAGFGALGQRLFPFCSQGAFLGFSFSSQTT